MRYLVPRVYQTHGQLLFPTRRREVQFRNVAMIALVIRNTVRWTTSSLVISR